MQRRSEETQEKILNAALELFSREGYDATGVAEICVEAGVSKGAFYHHFPSKQAVFVELLYRWIAALEGQLNLPIGDHVPQTLLKMASMTEGIFADTTGRLPMFLEFWRQASRNPEIWQATISPFAHFRNYFASLIQKGIDEGSLHPVDPIIAAQALVSMAVGLVLQGTLDPKGSDWSKTAEESIKLMLSGLERKDE